MPWRCPVRTRGLFLELRTGNGSGDRFLSGRTRATNTSDALKQLHGNMFTEFAPLFVHCNTPKRDLSDFFGLFRLTLTLSRA